MAGNGKYKAVISDMGGVIVKYSNPSLIEDLFKYAETNEKTDKIIADFELGNKDVKAIGRQVSAIEDEELKKEIITLLQGLSSSLATTDEPVVEAYKKLKGAGFKLALLTNTGWADEEKTKTMVPIDTTYFDVIVESCKIAMRKPFSDIYKYTLQQLALAPEECIFIDDLKINCIGAEELGMKAIQVVRGDSKAALKELEELTGISF